MLRHAKAMRREPSDAERAMWRLLRRHNLAGFKFRRQQGLGRYIPDFVCFERRLVIEADGGQHCGNILDHARDRAFEAAGYRVLRLWNNDILTNPEGTALAILAALSPSPTPASGRARKPAYPSPQGGRKDVRGSFPLAGEDGAAWSRSGLAQPGEG